MALNVISPNGELPQAEGDLEWYRLHRILEGDRLDYKRDMYGHGDEDKREMLRDVTSLANHRGGLLLIGVDEDDDGAASAVVGVEASGREPHDGWLLSSCLANIEPRIIGLRAHEVPLANGRVAVVVSVPESLQGPHMVTFRGLNQFWKRHGRRKDPMTVDEIRDTILRIRDRQAHIREFLEAREKYSLESFGGTCFFAVSAIPIQFEDTPILDVTDRNLRLEVAKWDLFNVTPSITIDGLLFRHEYTVSEHLRGACVLEVFRSGYIEFRFQVRVENLVPVFEARMWISEIMKFIQTCRQVCKGWLSSIDMIVNCSAYNADKLELVTPMVRKGLTKRPYGWGKLSFGSFGVEDFVAHGQRITKPLCDRLWNAFGFEAILDIGEDGEWAPGR